MHLQMIESVAAGAPFPAPQTRPAGTLAGKVAELPSLKVETRQLWGSGQTVRCARLLRAHPSFVRQPPSPVALPCVYTPPRNLGNLVKFRPLVFIACVPS